jgi:hypothetical protein
MKPKEFRLSVKQTEALERIAKENHATPADLASLAVDALIAEAARHEGWLPLPVMPGAARPSQVNRLKGEEVAVSKLRS